MKRKLKKADWIVRPDMKVMEDIGALLDGFYHNDHESGVKIADWVYDLFSYNNLLPPKNEKVKLVALTRQELGISPRASYQKICQKGKDLGYGLVKPEHLLALRIHYSSQPEKELLIGVMVPLFHSRAQEREGKRRRRVLVISNGYQEGKTIWTLTPSLLSKESKMRKRFGDYSEEKFVFCVPPEDNRN